MPPLPLPAFPCLGAGVVVLRGDQFLLIQRGQPPYAGHWAPPGGKVEWGETIQQTAQRELFEECAIMAEQYAFLKYYEFIEKDLTQNPYHYLVLDFVAQYNSGESQAAGDVLDAGWFCWQDLDRLKVAGTTRDVVRRALQFRENFK